MPTALETSPAPTLLVDSVVSVPSVTLPVAATSGLRRGLARLASALQPSSKLANAVADCARRQDVTPTAVLIVPQRALSSSADVALVLIHARTSPHQRVALLQALHTRFSQSGQRVLALAEPEWPVWRDSLGLALNLPVAAAWGALPPTSEPAAASLVRDALLRRASSLYLDDLHALLWSGGSADAVAALAARVRDLLAEVAVPARFPPLPARGATVDEQYAAAIGVFHAAFGGEVAGPGGDSGAAASRVAEGAGTDPQVDSGLKFQQPPRTAAAARHLLAPLLADLARPIAARMAALYLFPGPFGGRHCWQLVAVVPADAPLLQASALRRHLQQHLRMVSERHLAAVFGEAPSVLVLSEDALRGLLWRSLFRRPLNALSIHAHRQLLVGEDLVSAILAPTSDEFRALLRFEAAALLEATAGCWSAELGALAVRDLLFGCWPALLHLARGGALDDSLAVAHENLRSSTDPALSRVGSAANSNAWGDPSCVDLSRGKEMLREWGPCLLRLQEATLEAMG